MLIAAAATAATTTVCRSNDLYNLNRMIDEDINKNPNPKYRVTSIKSSKLVRKHKNAKSNNKVMKSFARRIGISICSSIFANLTNFFNSILVDQMINAGCRFAFRNQMIAT